LNYSESSFQHHKRWEVVKLIKDYTQALARAVSRHDTISDSNIRRILTLLQNRKKIIHLQSKRDKREKKENSFPFLPSKERLNLRIKIFNTSNFKRSAPWKSNYFSRNYHIRRLLKDISQADSDKLDKRFLFIKILPKIYWFLRHPLDRSKCISILSRFSSSIGLKISSFTYMWY